MAGEDKHSKKHPASDAKKRQLKKKGQVAKSTDVPMALGLVAAFGTMLALRGFYQKHMGSLLDHYYEALPSVRNDQLDVASLGLMAIRDIFVMSMPVLAAVLVVGVLANIGQTGLIIASEPLKPNLNKINPMTKLKQWFSVKSLQELLKSLVKILLAGWVGWLAWKSAIPQISQSVFLTEPQQLLSLGATIIKGMFIKVIILYLVIAFIDYMFQRRNFLNEHKMTDKEVKDEYKQQEGDPYMKAKRRQMAQQIAMAQSHEAVPQGDVTVINPTERAIVLKYDPDVSPVPYVIAKGETRQADEIRESSRKHGVPIVRNKPLARALFELCEVGDIVPAELFKPVAEVLAYVFALKEQSQGETAAAAAATHEQQPAAAAHASQAATAQQRLALGPDEVHELGQIMVPAVQPAGVSAEAAGYAPGPGTMQAQPTMAHAPAPVAQQQSPFSWSDQPPAW